MDRDDVALANFSEYFKKASDEEREHAEKLMKFQNQRGGRIVLKAIQVSVLIMYCYQLLQSTGKGVAGFSSPQMCVS